ncbi:hypothetical protein M9G62_RS26545, partial [Escherichia coli]
KKRCEIKETRHVHALIFPALTYVMIIITGSVVSLSGLYVYRGVTPCSPVFYAQYNKYAELPVTCAEKNNSSHFPYTD